MKDCFSLLTPSVEAIRMIERGDATAEDIDTAMKLGAGYRGFSTLVLLLTPQPWVYVLS